MLSLRNISLREGYYQRLVQRAVECLPRREVKERLIDLLDAQACVSLEEIWVQISNLKDSVSHN